MQPPRPSVRSRAGAFTVRGVAAVGTALGLVLMTPGTALAYDPALDINGAGGASPSDDLVVRYGAGQIQVVRDGVGQVYSSAANPGAVTDGNLFNGLYLTVGDTVVGPDHFMSGAPAGSVNALVEWDTITATGGSASGPGTITSALSWTDPDTALVYTIDLELSYASTADDYYTETAVVDIPVGNSKSVKLYRAIDTTLNGVDEGAGFYRGGAHPVVGVLAEAGDVVEGLRHVSGPAWTGYWSGDFSCLFADCEVDGYLSWGRDYPTGSSAINPDSGTDNGIGLNWDLAATAGGTGGDVAPAGTETFVYDLVFSDDIALAGTAQSITWATPSDVRLSDGTRTLAATASSGLPVTYVSESPAVCTVSGQTVTLLTLGTCEVRALQGGDWTYAPAVSVLRTFGVVPDGTTPQVVTFTPPATAGTVGGTVPLSGTSDSGLPVSYSSLTPSVCSVSGSTATLLTAGTCTVRALQSGDPTYAAAAAVDRSFVVGAAGVGGAPGGGSGAPAGSAMTRSAARGNLAYTGVEVTPLIGAAAALVTGGGGLLWAARRRRTGIA